MKPESHLLSKLLVEKGSMGLERRRESGSRYCLVAVEKSDLLYVTICVSSMSPLLSHVCGPAVDPAVVIHRSCIIQTREILQFEPYTIVKIGAFLYLSTAWCSLEYKRVDMVK